MSICYENAKSEDELLTNSEHLALLKGSKRAYLEEKTLSIGIERFIKRLFRA
ncbi:MULTISPECIES: hypothetical protein [unclassified Photobacterium]|uniref:hypothetical protein n=1 Tax=unclassified Photobacterium TaxID=2628852 RepID=UPI001EDEEB03|nr:MULTISPECIES: hypothetical protein [unclassified Photobacterium]MCG3863790.1 hypothetical protein [Photobacterium sp. Ph6]MCG3875320.1 hypothetical protein [Photobacterium sp. Ph5]